MTRDDRARRDRNTALPRDRLQVDVVTSNMAGSVSVLLGIGDGTLGAKTDYAAGSSPMAAGLGDLNGDGILDVATANRSSKSVSVLLGLGNGTLAAKVDYPTGREPAALALGDLNDDGRLDIVTVNRAEDSLSVLLGTGEGKFATKADFAVCWDPDSVAVGDLNGDGFPDVVVGSGYRAGVSVLMGVGDGSFPRKTDIASRSNTDQTIATLADLDGDGNLDIVETDFSGDPKVLKGRGDGTFAPEVTYQIARVFDAMTLDDWDGDGSVDLIGVTTDTNVVSVLAGAPGGTFAAWTMYSVWGISAAPGDLNGDGIVDWVGAGGLTPAEVGAALGAGDGTFTALAQSTFEREAQSAAVGDVNGDGRLDLVVAADRMSTSESIVLLGTGTGAFVTGAEFATSDDPLAIELADLNADGKLDIVLLDAPLAEEGSVGVLLGKGDGTFGPTTAVPTMMAPSAMLLADLNTDGKLDVVVLSTWFSVVRVLLGSGDGKLTPGKDRQLGQLGDEPSEIALGDFNRDGKPDLAVAYGSYADKALGVLIGAGDGTFAAETTYEAESGSDASVAAIDVDNDGKLDLLFSSYYNATDKSKVFYGNGDGTFGKPSSIHSVGSVRAMDLNGDGMSDLISAKGALRVLLSVCK